jgi:hypothetical protein
LFNQIESGAKADLGLVKTLEGRVFQLLRLSLLLSSIGISAVTALPASGRNDYADQQEQSD